MPRELSKNQISNGLSYTAQTPKFLQNFGKPIAARSPPPEHHPSYDPAIHSASSRARREDLPERPKDGKWAGGSDDEGEKGGRGRGRDSDDEWGEVYGGGGDDGPQVVVLKEGRHLSEAEVRRERRRGKITEVSAGSEKFVQPVTWAREEGEKGPEVPRDRAQGREGRQKGRSEPRAGPDAQWHDSWLTTAAGKPSASPPPTTTKDVKVDTGEKSSPTVPASSAKLTTSDKKSIPKLGAASAKRKLVGLGADEGETKEPASGADGKKKKKKAAKGLLSFDEADGEA